MSKSSLALSNLRAVVISIVLAFHSCLAYLASNPQPGPFLGPPFTWESFPIIDTHRWLGFDIFCAWQDVSLMALMFFLSGLLTGPSLERKGARVYMADRLRRIGLPFVWALLLLSPVALYPAYAMRVPEPTVAGFWQDWFSLPFWPNGPQWFLWQLLVLNAMAAAVYAAAPNLLREARRFAAWAGRHPVGYFGAVTGAATLVYAPLAFVFSPWHWVEYGPIALQLCRPGLYIVVFFAGVALGSYGLDRGLLACDGPLARRWAWWFGAALVAFFIWAGCASLTFPHWEAAGWAGKVGASLTYAPACLAGGTLMLALFLRFSRMRSRILDSLSANAYTMYLVHYVFVVWLQYTLLPTDLAAPLKAAVVFIGTLALSWPSAIALNWLLTGAIPIPSKRPVWTTSR